MMAGDEVEAVLDRDLDVVAHSACPELDAHREAISGRLAHLFDLDEEIVAAEDVGVARRGAQVDAGGNAADAGELRRDLLRHELAAEAGLRAFHYRV